MQWIADREVVASSSELGQDYDHVNMLQERFKVFATDTQAIGTERVAKANAHADRLIDAGHADAAQIAEWKDGLNEAWTDLLELIDTRQQMLQASIELHKFFHDCKDVLGMIMEKVNSISDELGRDAQSVTAHQRKHASFEQDLVTLAHNVQGVQEKSMELQASYAGDKAREIQNREAEVVHAWRNLQNMVEGRKMKLVDTGDLYKFYGLVRDLMLWMEDIFRIMRSDEKPRDVSGVELLMNQHQSTKAEIDAREENFAICINLGQNLLARKHYASEEIKDKLTALTNQRQEMMEKWEHRWEHLQLILEVYQFARDASVAEAWLYAQEPYLYSAELGKTLDEVENLLKKHESFEKSAVAQEDRFTALQRLTTYELKEARKKQEAEEARRKEEEAAKQPSPDGVDGVEGAEGMLNGDKESPATPPTTPTDAPSKPPALVVSLTSSARSPTRRRSGEKRAPSEPLPSPSRRRAKEGAGEDGTMEGMLVRKHEWESTTKKASNRSWDKVYCMLADAKLSFYKDSKHAKLEPPQPLRNEAPIDLAEAVVDKATDYTKKKHVFRLKQPNGGEYLFQAKDEDELSFWLQKIAAVSPKSGGAEGTSGEPARSQTLPAPQTEEKKDEHKKRSFFTLRKGGK